MALIEELHRPQIGFVPIGDRFTMGARQAALACRKFFNFKTIVPIHYGTFPIIDPDASRFLAEMAGHNVVTPKPGEAFDASV
jgi:L-ascorbate metabolism protein UlaG (beta-lactamase superfamily)